MVDINDFPISLEIGKLHSKKIPIRKFRKYLVRRQTDKVRLLKMTTETIKESLSGSDRYCIALMGYNFR